jgi:hypothetical protein
VLTVLYVGGGVGLAGDEDSGDLGWQRQRGGCTPPGRWHGSIEGPARCTAQVTRDISTVHVTHPIDTVPRVCCMIADAHAYHPDP